MTVKLRKTTPEDSLFLWKLRNDTEVRKQSFDSRRVSWRGHKLWITNKLSDIACDFWIIVAGNIRAGQVRFDHTKKTSLLSIALTKKFRDKGLGAKCLMLAIRKHFKTSKVKSITAYIKENNKRSIACFQSAGFKQAGTSKVKKQKCLRFVIQN